jgi:hypothetical protein
VIDVGAALVGIGQERKEEAGACVDLFFFFFCSPQTGCCSILVACVAVHFERSKSDQMGSKVIKYDQNAIVPESDNCRSKW